MGRKVQLSAVNHWERAIETHSANHPKAAHFCQSLADLDPKKAVPGGKLDLLVASPECTHHSVARGGKPVNDQSRSSAYCVHRWCAALDVKRVLIENVPEFVGWGPLDGKGRPLKSKKGSLFVAFIDTLKAMGYRVEWRILNAADYGGATTRRRLFIQCAKGRLAIRWPERTHEPDPQPSLVAMLPKWRAAREIIDWSMAGQSIFTRKRPLSPNTLKRIEAGLRKFGGANAEPFLVLLRGTGQDQIGSTAVSLDGPVPPVTTSGAHHALCEPFITTMNYTGSREHDDRYSRDVSDPIPTITSQGNRFGLVEPFTIHTTHHGGDRISDTADPLPCVTGANRGEQALIEPFVMRASNGGDHNCRNKSINEPIGTIHAGGGSFGLVEPFLVPTNYGEREGQSPRCHDIEKPCPTVVAGGSTHGLVEPFIVPQHSSNDPRSIDSPTPTLTTTSRGVGLCEPFLVPFYANGQADATTDPLRTVTTKDRHALCEPDRARLDIRFRMLQPHELAAAMGFPKGYKITGNRGEQVKQVGNAVEVHQATALILAMLEDAA